MSDHHSFVVFCPNCGEKNDGYTDAKGGGAQPDDGAASICVYCALPAIFTKVGDELHLRLPTREERTSLEADEHYQIAIMAILQAKVAGRL